MRSVLHAYLGIAFQFQVFHLVFKPYVSILASVCLDFHLQSCLRAFLLVALRENACLCAGSDNGDCWEWIGLLISTLFSECFSCQLLPVSKAQVSECPKAFDPCCQSGPVPWPMLPSMTLPRALPRGLCLLALEFCLSLHGLLQVWSGMALLELDLWVYVGTWGVCYLLAGPMTS